MMIDVKPASLELISKVCKKCGNIRRFVKGTPRDIQGICGNCWDWQKEPSYLRLTDEEAKKLQKLLNPV